MTGLVFNPDDEQDSFLYGAVEYNLKPGVTKVLSAIIAKHAESVLGIWGVRALTGDLKEDKGIQAEAVAYYKKATRVWAEEVVTDFVAATKSRREAGLKVEDTPAVLKAKAWLQKYGFLG